MLRRMVLSDWPSTPWLENQTLFFELLDIKFIQLERKLNFKTYRTLESIPRCREMQAWFPSGVMFLHVRYE